MLRVHVPSPCPQSMLAVHASSPCPKSMPPAETPYKYEDLSPACTLTLPTLDTAPSTSTMDTDLSTSTMAPALSLPSMMVPEPSLSSTMDPAPSTFTMDPALSTSTMDTATSASTMAPAPLLSSTMAPALSLSNMMAPVSSPSSVSTSSVSPSSVSPSSVSPSPVSTSSAVPSSSKQYPAVPRSTQQYTENPEDVAETAAKEKAEDQAEEEAMEAVKKKAEEQAEDVAEKAAKEKAEEQADKQAKELAEEKAAKEAATEKEGTKKKDVSEKPVPGINPGWPVLLLSILLAIQFLHHSPGPWTVPRPRWTGTRTPASWTTPPPTGRWPPTRTTTASGSTRTPASWSSSPSNTVTTHTPARPSRHKMMHTKDEVHVWPNSHPRGGGGHIHSSCKNKNKEHIRQDDHHRASLYMDINLSWYLPSHHSTKPDKYDGSARVSLQEGIPLAVPDSTGQSKLFKSPTKLHEEPIPMATTPPHRKTIPKDMSISMDNHSFSPTVTTATLKKYKDHLKMGKYKDSHMESSIRSHMKKDTYNVPGSISHTRSLTRHKPVIKFGNYHKTSTPKDQLKMVEYEASHMENLNQFYIKRNNYDVPSSVRHPKNAPSISLNLDLSPNMAKKALKMLEYEQNVLSSNMMICSSGYLNSHQVQKKLQSQKRALQYKVKTSSDSDATQDPDLARDEGLHPRGGITRHHALPVNPEFYRVLASCSNPIAAAK